MIYGLVHKSEFSYSKYKKAVLNLENGTHDRILKNYENHKMILLEVSHLRNLIILILSNIL